MAHDSGQGSVHDTIFYRYMSRSEAEAIRSSDLLRGGRPGRTFWTDICYHSAGEAKALLALEYYPEVRLAFRITSNPELLRDDTPVAPDNQEPGGGTEWMVLDPVEVEVIAVDNLE
jgi:hypothetical protein